jgi:hypothetical protein
MAQQTQQAQALAAAASVANLMSQLRALQNSVNAFLLTYNDQNYGALWATFPTLAFNANGTAGIYDATSGSGTVSVSTGGQVLTFSESQTGLAGAYITIQGDTSNGLYLVGNGNGVTWPIATAFTGPTLSGAFWGTTTPNTAHPIAIPLNAPLLMAEGNLVTAVGCLENFQSYMTGVAIATQVNTPQKFADILNS